MGDQDTIKSVEEVVQNGVNEAAGAIRNVIEEKLQTPSVHVPLNSPGLALAEPTICGELAKVGRALKSNPLHSEISQTLLWTLPIRTGILFFNINLFFFLVTYGSYSVLTLFSYCALALLVVAFAYSQGTVLWAKTVQGRTIENPLTQKWRVSPISRALIEKHMDSLNNLANALLDIAMDVFLCGFPLFSLKVAGILYLSALVGGCLDGITLLWLVSVVAFAWPRLYAEKKNEIDSVVNLVNTQIDTYTALVLSKINKTPLPAAAAAPSKRKAH